ncbi:DUF5808 domain-containing protein [Microtetraspora sp. NBRC 16547]|uniref:DUF1648 domain-containing protein n=1 Tax=Microtetraspora sp. NBRC 16547 TaxID=3030993 RepID=UPI0024A4BF87|nr:DUF5808 domain-containing protein [Microtetraspora sp. NBRC 16547]GLW96642.1 hypothetical protein Misp02_07290 [Microtetraspora sp. NBRC 16547]
MTPLIAADLTVVVLVTCLMLAVPAMAGPTTPFGVRVSRARAADPAVIAQRRAYARLALAAGVCAVAVSVPVLVGGGSATVIGATATALIVADLLLYWRAARRLSAAKLAGGWRDEQRQGVTVDTTFRTDPVRLPWSWTLPASAILLLTAGLGWWRYGDLPATLPGFPGYGVDAARREPVTVLTAFAPVLYQLAISLLIPAVTLLLLHARPDLDAARPMGSARRYRAYLGGVARLSLLGAACLNLGLLASALQLWTVVEPSMLWTVVTYLPLVALLVAWLVWESRVGHAGHRLPALPGEKDEDSGVTQRDDDRHWFLAGTVYVNRRDPAILLHARIGASWTLNLGHPVAWVLLAVLVVAGLLAAFGVIDLPVRHSGL